jgi:hypothetical protein
MGGGIFFVNLKNFIKMQKKVAVVNLVISCFYLMKQPMNFE